LFEKLEGIYDTFTTLTHYSRNQIKVAEAAVLAVIADDFAAGRTVVFWRDEDEFLIRRRIHHDVRVLSSSPIWSD
jgi:hypothetical protein